MLEGMPLLERDHVLASLAEYAAASGSGEGRFVLVSGEAGVGKSTLLDAFAAASPDLHWVRGACDGLSTPRPLGPLFDMAETLGGKLLAACRGGATRDELFATLVRQLDTPGKPAVLAIEDIHWADESTLDLLRFLGRRIRDLPVLLIATYRDDELAPGDPLRQVLGDLATQRSTRRIDVAPLSENAVAVLAGDSGLSPAELFRLTGGNPFFVTEIVRSPADRIPPSARDSVLARVARLSPAARRAIGAAALIGAQVDPVLLAEVTGSDADVLDELVQSGLLVSGADAVRFRHEITRLAVEQQLPVHRRAPVHAGVLAALLEQGCTDDARLAYHAEGADDGVAVLVHAPRAARRAADLASRREAVAQYERALRYRELAAPMAVARLYSGLGEQAALLDRWELAAEASHRALALWRELGETLRVGDTLRRLSSAMIKLCQGEASFRHVREAIEVLQPLGPSTELARAYSQLAGMLMCNSANDEALVYARRSRQLAETLSAADVLCDALGTEGCALADSSPDWAVSLRRSLAIALEHELEDQAGRAYCNLYGIYVDSRQYAVGEPYFVAGAAYCTEHDLRSHGTFLWAAKAMALLHQGDWGEALRVSQRLLEGAEVSPMNSICLINRVGTIRARRGDPGAWDLLDRAIADSDSLGEPQYVVPIRLVRAETRWSEEDPDQARREAELAAAAIGECVEEWLLGEVAIWLRRTGSDQRVPGSLAGPYRHALAGDWRAAADAWTAQGCPFDAAMALLDADDETALREALALFDELGAAPAARVARKKMRRLGIRSVPAGPRSATRANSAGLTRREGEILHLLRAGRTNSEIADELFIAVKTVDNHVSSVLAKLGVTSRNAVAAAATRLGLG